MKKRQFVTSLSCQKCGTVGKRIFENFKKEDLMEHAGVYIILDWICCATETCRNFFGKPHSLSRCPVCKHWSVKLTGNGEMQEWNCLNHKECGWKISLPNIS